MGETGGKKVIGQKLGPVFNEKLYVGRLGYPGGRVTPHMTHIT